MRTIQNAFVLAMVAGLFTPMGHAWAGKPVSCYTADVPAPAVRTQTVVVIDDTTAPDADVVDAFAQAAARAAMTPNQRYVVLSFSALGPRQGLKKHAEWVIEGPITDPERADELPMKPFRASQRCVKATAAAWPLRAEASVRQAIKGAGDRAKYKRSEIVHSLSKVLDHFGDPDFQHTTLLMLSDAYENGSLGRGSTGISMYGRDGRPRSIDARKELARLPPEFLARRVRGGAWDVTWFGLMNEGQDREARYADVQTVSQVRQFWELLLVQRWGASSLVIDRIPVTAPDSGRWRQAVAPQESLRRDDRQEIAGPPQWPRVAERGRPVRNKQTASDTREPVAR